MPAAVAAVPAAIGLIGSGLSYMSAKDAQSAAEDQANKQREMQERGLSLSEWQARKAEERAMLEEKMFAPIKERLIREGMSEKPAGWDTAANQIKGAYGELSRRMGTANPNAGLAAAGMQTAALRKGSSLAEAYQAAKDKQRAALMGLMGLDNSQQMRSAEERANAQRLGQMGSLASSFGTWANQMGQSAQQGYNNAWKGLAQGIASGSDWLTNRNVSEAPEMASTENYGYQQPMQPITPNIPSGYSGLMPPSNIGVDDSTYDSYFTPGDYTIKD